MFCNSQLMQSFKHLIKFHIMPKNGYQFRRNLSSSNTNPIIELQQGKIRGVAENNVYGVQFMAFRGIPYAKPPVGHLRFKDPEPVEPWSGIRDATKYGHQSLQKHIIFKKIVGSEDCLFLNVYTSDINPTKPRAVMVFIHGGTFTHGSGDDDVYGPDHLIEKDIVLITINYRLGILGFLDLEDDVATGNQGLKDQVLALKWVQQNISKFGGDPHNVTIFGQSAGGGCVHYLTLSPLSQGLFHKAIMQSAVAINPGITPIYPIKEKAQKLSAILGNEITDPKKLVEFLRTVDVTQLMEAMSSPQSWKDRFLLINPFAVTTDVKSKNPFMPLPIQEAVKAGIKVPCMFGYLSHEAILILSDLTDDKFEQINANQEDLLIHPVVKKFFHERNISVNDLKKVFIGDEKIVPKHMQKLGDLMNFVQLMFGLHQILEIQMQVSNVPAYLYKFEYDDENPLMQRLLRSNMKGTSHMEDLAYLFYPKLYKMLGYKAPTPGSTKHMISQRFIELWTNFAKTGNPTPQTSDLIPIDWKPIDNPIKYNCLRISEDISMIKDSNILVETMMNIQKSKL